MYIIYEITCPFHVLTFTDLLAYSADDSVQRYIGPSGTNASIRIKSETVKIYYVNYITFDKVLLW